MNGVHDMGGMHGFGAIDLREHPAETWELRVAAMMYASAAAKLLNSDAFRFAIEQMPPATYLGSAYFERWLTSVEANHLRQGTYSATELRERQTHYQQHPDAPLPKLIASDEKVRTANWPYFQQLPEASAPTMSEVTTENQKPRFSIGDSVIVTNLHPEGHTRRPRYVRAKRGVIIRIQALEVFADTNADYQKADRQFVYNVEFDGHELWGESAEPNQVVSIDLWESYLAPA